MPILSGVCCRGCPPPPLSSSGCEVLGIHLELRVVAFDFAHRLSQVKTPSEFVSLSTEHARKQFETLAEQTKQLAALAQKVTVASAEPLKPSSPRQRH